MITGLKKKDKVSAITFNEESDVIHVATYNAKLKKALTRFQKACPDCCRLIYDDPERSYMEFDVLKGRLTFRLTKPYGDDRRRKLQKNIRYKRECVSNNSH